MKNSLLLFAVVAVTASVIYAAPIDGNGEITIQKVRFFIEKALKQSEKVNEKVQAQSTLLANEQQDGTLQEKKASKQLIGTLLGLSAPQIIGHGG